VSLRPHVPIAGDRAEPSRCVAPGIQRDDDDRHGTIGELPLCREHIGHHERADRLAVAIREGDDDWPAAKAVQRNRLTMLCSLWRTAFLAWVSND